MRMAFLTSRFSDRGALVGYVEGVFKGYARLDDSGFVEQLADEGDAVGYAAGWAELWQGMGRVRGPVAAGLAYLHEARAQSERGVTCEIGDREDFVAKRGDQQQVHLAHDALHFERDLATHSVSLNEVYCGEEARLAESVGPGVGDLHAKLVVGVRKGELFKGGGGLCEQYGV